MLIVGLTGGIGTGKTTVAKMFAKLGAKVIDADDIAKRCIYKNGICFEEVVDTFGDDILTRGRIDRKKLASVVFNNKRQLKKLENIIHPKVIEIIKKKIISYEERGVKIVVLDVPLLFESGLDEMSDIIIVVVTNKKVQVERAVKSLGISKEEVLNRISAQMTMKEKILLSDRSINNNGSLKQTRKAVKDVWVDCNRLE